MKNKISNWVIAVLLVIIAVLIYQYLSKPVVPVVKDGAISGEYSLASLLTLQTPLKCTFEKADGVSKILATLYTNKEDVYADLRIQTDSREIGIFNGFLLIKDKTTYTWTSLSNLGYQSKTTSSASRNASAREQAQLIGLKDKLPYECNVLKEADPTLFELPTYITFSESK